MQAFYDNYEIVFHPAITHDMNLEEAVDSVLNSDDNLDVFVLEGAVSEKDGNIYKVNNLTFTEAIQRIVNKSNYVVAVGNCAVFGNIPALKDENVMGLQYRYKRKGGLLGPNFRSLSGLPVINISGCPAHPEWILGTLLNIAAGRKLKLDEFGRPVDFYSYFTHDGCIRNQYFEWKVEMEELGHKEGCLFYNFGCRGPLTRSSCNRILWNGVSSKTRSGQPCFGCTEFDFPRNDLWETKYLMGVPAELPPGISKRGYILLAGTAKTFAPKRLKEKLIDYED